MDRSRDGPVVLVQEMLWCDSTRPSVKYDKAVHRSRVCRDEDHEADYHWPAEELYSHGKSNGACDEPVAALALAHTVRVRS
jgi:hypothetical protein